MTNPPYYVLKLWIELYQSDYCERSYSYALDMIEKHCGSVDEAYSLSNWYSCHIVMGTPPEELTELANNYK